MNELQRKIMLAAVATGVLAAATLMYLALREQRDPAVHDERSFAAARNMFAEALAGGAAWQDDLAELGLELRREPGVIDGMMIAEPHGQCLGQGAYVLRGRDAAPLAITAPHRRSDLHTGAIAEALYAATGARAAAWNSAPRWSSQECPAGRDLARSDLHFFTAFALAFAEAHPAGRVVQLHGFDGERRSSEAARQSAMILSDGTREPSSQLLDLADCLSIAFEPRTVLVYPIETGELGALANAQSRALRSAGFRGFVHLEMSAELREALANDTSLQAALARCLAEQAP